MPCGGTVDMCQDGNSRAIWPEVAFSCPTGKLGKIVRVGDQLLLRNIGETVSQFSGGWVGCTPDPGGYKDWIYWPTTSDWTNAQKFTINSNTSTDAVGKWTNNDPSGPVPDNMRVPIMYAAKGDAPGTKLYGLFTSNAATCSQNSEAKWWAMGATARVNPSFSNGWAWKLRGFTNSAYSDFDWERTQLFFFPIKQQAQDNFVRYGDTFMIVPVRINNAWKDRLFVGYSRDSDPRPNFVTAPVINDLLKSGYDNPYNPPDGESVWTRMVPDPSAVIGTPFYHFCFPKEGISKCLGKTNGAFQYAFPADLFNDNGSWRNQITTCGSQCGEDIQYIPLYTAFYTFVDPVGPAIDCTDQDNTPTDNPCSRKPCTCCKPGTTVCDKDGSVIVKCKWMNEANPEELPVYDWACPCSADDACTDKLCPDKPCPDGEECIKNDDTGECKCQPKKPKITLAIKIVIGFGIALFVIVLVAFIFNLFKKKNDSPTGGDGSGG